MFALSAGAGGSLRWRPMLLLGWLFGLSVLLAAPGAAVVLTDLRNPGYHDKPEWFKNSFLDIAEDLAEAVADDKRLLLYFYQDGCPYCERLLRENLGDREIAATARDHFDLIAINMWGDREVTALDGSATTEKGLAETLGVQYTPTMLLFDEAGEVVLRIDGYYPPHQFHAALRYVAERREEREPFIDFYRQLAPTAASGQLHQEPDFLAHPLRLAENRAHSARPLVVMFEQPVCAACDELHQEILRAVPVAYALSAFDGAILDIGSTEVVQTPDGRELPARDWALELGIHYTPSLVFFAADGEEVFRTEAYLKGFHVHGALDYVATGAYAWEPSFQRFLQARTASLYARGVPIDMME